MKKWQYIKDENADEKGAGGAWDLAGEIVDEIQSASEINASVLQDLVYHKLRGYVDETVEINNCGKWKIKWDAEKDPNRYFLRLVCSECGLVTGVKSNFCPCCGARMKGDLE